jgi:hypothetical protein
MRRRLLLNVGLAAIVAALVLVVWLEPGIDRETGPARLTALDADVIGRIEIQRSGHDGIIIERSDGQWRLLAPLEAPANEFRIEPLLRIADATTHAHFEAGAGELARYGLDPPRAVLRIDDVEIAFGDTEALDHRRYMRIGNVVHLVEDHYLHRLQTGYASFVSNRLLPEGSRPVRLSLPDFTLAMDAEGRWNTAPEQDFSMDALNRIVDAWIHARAIIVDAYDGDAAQGTISVSLLGRDEPIEFHVIESDVDLILALPEAGLVYHLGSDQGIRMLGRTPHADEPMP